MLHFPGGLRDSLQADIGERALVLPQPWAGEADLPAGADGQAAGRLEWAVSWVEEGEGFVHSYCNTIPTTQGGTHEAGFRAALMKGLRAWGEHRGNRRAGQMVPDDLLDPIAAKLMGIRIGSVFSAAWALSTMLGAFVGHGCGDRVNETFGCRSRRNEPKDDGGP